MSNSPVIAFQTEYLTFPDADGKPLGTSAALFLSLLLALSGEEAEVTGWFALSPQRGEDMVGFSHDTQKRLRERLMAAGYIRYRFKGQGGQIQYFLCTQDAYKDGADEAVCTQDAYKGEALPPSSPPSLSLSDSLSLNPPIIPPPGEREKSKPKENGESAEFQAFYALYPNKKARPKALQAWKHINPNVETIAKIMTGLGRDCREWHKGDPEFIPHPATWLNQRRWEDEGLPLDFCQTRGSPPARNGHKPPMKTSAEKDAEEWEALKRISQKGGFSFGGRT